MKIKIRKYRLKNCEHLKCGVYGSPGPSSFCGPAKYAVKITCLENGQRVYSGSVIVCEKHSAVNEIEFWFFDRYRDVIAVQKDGIVKFEENETLEPIFPQITIPKLLKLMSDGKEDDKVDQFHNL